MTVTDIRVQLLFICCALQFIGGYADGDGKEHTSKCIDGSLHKKSPSAETQQFSQCQPWKTFSCCTSNYTKELASNNTRARYLHGWHGCGKLSQQCMEFWFAQKCFYQCSPFIYPWKNPDHRGSIKGIPICADYCDKWFGACKDDIICVTDPLKGVNVSAHDQNFCSQNENCTSYSSTFRDGKGLCSKLWGAAYMYQNPNLERSNCMDMWFNGSNPNANVNRETKHTGQAIIGTMPTVWVVAVGVFAAVAIEFTWAM